MSLFLNQILYIWDFNCIRINFNSIMIGITISNKILEVCPNFKFAAVVCKIKNSPYHSGLWEEIKLFSKQFADSHKMSDINKRPAILETRQVYKALGKDPNRYRPSSEALCRRIIKGTELYQIDTVVDLINLISLQSGYSIGGFDAEQIEGDLILGVGEADEPFDAIGRGLLNIEGLPVYRDSAGGIGTPTSDVERTKITSETTRILMIINGYLGKKGLSETLESSIQKLQKYADATEVQIITNLNEE